MDISCGEPKRAAFSNVEVYVEESALDFENVIGKFNGRAKLLLLTSFSISMDKNVFRFERSEGEA